MINLLKTGNTNNRLAIVDYDKCKPNKCGKECVIRCPPNQAGKICISVEDIEELGKKAKIATGFCIGCGICVKACPFNAIKMVNLPHELTKDKMLVGYGENSFRLYMHPHIKKGYCMGIIGSNGLGKTTIIKILSGEIRIDLKMKEKKKLLSGSETYGYLTKLENGMKISYKPQDISLYNKGKYGSTLVKTLIENMPKAILVSMDLEKLSDRLTKQLSGGETQRLLIALSCSKKAESYLFDEPTAFLDIKQRINAADLIQEKVNNAYVVLIEHDLCIFDYISDYVMCLYGEKGAYGVISSVSGTFNGINNYLEGELKTENIKFRDKPVRFRNITMEDEMIEKSDYYYGGCSYKYEDTGFQLEIEPGTFSTSEITLLIGENGTGKTTMIKILAGMISLKDFARPELSVSIKEQEVYVESQQLVRDYMYSKIGNILFDSDFKMNVLIPLGVESIMDYKMFTLSGGQTQRVGITVCLGTKADVYLLDEPSAFIDVEDRMQISKILRQFALSSKKSIFLVEHDMIMATSTCDRVIVFTGDPGIKCKASAPQDIKTGINKFLSILGVTMRRDKYSGSGRPRINKSGSQRDKEQKKTGEYFILE